MAAESGRMHNILKIKYLSQKEQLYCYMIVPFEIYAIEIKVLTNYLVYSIKKCIQHKCFQVNIYVLNLNRK